MELRTTLPNSRSWVHYAYLQLTLLDGTGLGGVVENLGLLWPAWDTSQEPHISNKQSLKK